MTAMDAGAAFLEEMPEDPVALWEAFYERGWSDGLPIVAPTPERVAAMLEGVTGHRDDVVGRVPPSHNEVTLEKIAVNAVMAGCPAGSVPVLVAAVKGISAQAFRLLTVGTAPSTPAIFLNGPVREELGVNCSFCALGGITRANATLGRALRLICLNLGNGGARTILDQATHGLPTRISFCFGENEDANPWEPFHVEQGFAPGESTATVINATTVIDMLEQEAQTADSVARTFAGSMTFQGSTHMLNGMGDPWVVLGVEHAALFHREGLTKDDVRQLLWEKCWLPLERFPPEVLQKFEVMGRRLDGDRAYLCAGPENLQIVVAGGFGPRSLFISIGGAHQIHAIEP